jgi:hypothetical protein
MAIIRRTALIECPIEDVFDFAVDSRNRHTRCSSWPRC